MYDLLNNLYPDRIEEPNSVNDIISNKYYVYILTLSNNPIVVGHGKKNRAKIIFDNINQITANHLKALFVRIYRLFSVNEQFDQYLIECTDKEEAKFIEANLHKIIGGNKRNLSNEITNNLYKDFSDNSLEYMVLKMALCSSFDGISDIKKWRREGILYGAVWENIKEKLKLDYK